LLLLSYRIVRNVKRRSALLRDQPQTPLERGVFWVEYVIRNGADSGLRSPTRDMYWFEVYAVHVWAVVFVLLTTVIMILWAGFKNVVRRVGWVSNGGRGRQLT
jgi:hypothetical protein